LTRHQGAAGNGRLLKFAIIAEVWYSGGTLSKTAAGVILNRAAEINFFFDGELFNNQGEY
jgi:hypothetical protein